MFKELKFLEGQIWGVKMGGGDILKDETFGEKYFGLKNFLCKTLGT